MPIDRGMHKEDVGGWGGSGGLEAGAEAPPGFPGESVDVTGARLAPNDD